jgi:nucleoside-diphosphate-sugar epimerase
MSKTNKFHRHFVEEDLARVVVPMDLSQLNNSSLLITGASGFMGIWLTELLTYLIKSQQLKLKLYLLATDFTFAKREAPHLYEPNEYLQVICDDVRSLHELPTDVEWIIHAAASPDLRVHNSQPIYASQTITQGTLTLLECVTRLPRLKGFLNISSGYVYGYYSTKELITERNFDGFDPSVFSTAYLEAKRYAESLCTIFRNQFRLPIINARPFSFVGPYQSVDAPWAVNNFINDAVNNQPIRIQGDGTVVRSYMYGADMAWWLLNMLLRGESGRSYNLGSQKAITLKELAGKIRYLSGDKIEINYSRALLKSKPSVFVPSVELAQADMGLKMQFDIDAALSRTIQWYAKPAT